ncbi:hypothetical protein CW740_06260 [Kangiella profundi]|uniref:Uncharacterized protein n=1 Tax=Kangiella profundi TaxID=1561924 RepID=A0A2K9A823_9GAMM|nr:hypothetical protein [Kangiella profundi]AUD78870.1 hypothetical protein CW740_06260 [Kangiella profundi]GGF03412.1 hypothetical protein GCM10011356_16410 [Kangiella profundi]
MCDLDIFYGLLIAAQVALIAAIVAVGAAAASNAGFFTVGAAPVAMTVASVALGASIASLGGASYALYDFWECAGSPDECSAIFASLESALAGLMADLAVALVTCLGLIGVMAAPFVGAAAAIAFLAVLGIYIAVFGTAIYFLEELKSCIESVPASTTGPLAEAVPFIYFYILIPITVVTLAVTVYKRKKKTNITHHN